MSKIKVSKTKKERKSQEWPLVVYMWMFGFGIFGYVFARIALASFPHPWHWAFGLAGGLLGMLAGWAWYRWRGDII